MSENFGPSTKKIYHCSRTSFNTFKGTFEGENFDWDPPFQRFLSRFWVVCSNFCQNVFRAVVKTTSYVSRRKFWLVFCRICGFFSKFEQTFFEVLIVKFQHCFQNKFQHVQRNNWRKKASFTLLSHFLFWVNSSSSFGKSTSAVLPKLNSTFPGEAFSIFFWKCYNFAYFSDLKRKKYSNVTENDRHRCQATFDVSQETIGRKIPSVENFVAVTFLSDFESFFLLFWPEGLAGLLELCVCLSVVLFADFFSEIVDFSKTIGIEQKHIKFLAVNIRQCCQKIKLHVQKKKEGKNIS